MKSRDLPRVVPPTPPPQPSCAACQVFRPDVIVPYGDGAIECCYLCAHHIVEHGCTLEEAYENECECLPTEIYPRSRYGSSDAEFEKQRDEMLARRARA